MFEIVILTRDAQGNVLYDEDGNPKRKLFTAKDGYELSRVWMRNGPSPTRRKGRAAKGKEVKSAVGSMEEYAAEITKKKRGNYEDVPAEQEGN